MHVKEFAEAAHGEYFEIRVGQVRNCRWVTTHARKSISMSSQMLQIGIQPLELFSCEMNFSHTSVMSGCPRWLTTIKLWSHFSPMTKPINCRRRSWWFLSFSKNIINAMRYPPFKICIVRFGSSFSPPVIPFLEHVCHILVDGPIWAFSWPIFISWQLSPTKLSKVVASNSSPW